MPSTVRDAPLLDKSWRRVEAFDEAGPAHLVASGSDLGDNGDWTYEEEDELITLDLGSDSRRLVQMSQEYSIAGLETDTPYVRLGNLLFKGTWDKLIGTEILLQDKRESGRSQSHQRTLWPLPVTETDRKLHRPPSTTRRRIVLRQAVNMATREAALVPKPGMPIPPLWRHNPLLQKAKTGLIVEKGHVWIRGRGWMKKEDAVILRRLGNISLTEGDAPQRATSTGEGQQEGEQAVEEAEAAEEEQGEDEGVANEDGAEIVGDDALTDAPPAATSTEAESTTAPDGKVKKKGGRTKMTENEKMRAAIHRALRKVEAIRNSANEEPITDSDEEQEE